MANYNDDKISVIGGISEGLVKSIRLDIRPSGVVVNPVTNLVYVSNDLSDVVHVINGLTDNSSVGINFRINPPKSGNVICNGARIFEDVFLRYDLGSALTCKAEDTNAFVFSYWSGSEGATSVDNSRIVNFSASNYRDVVANFIQAPSRSIIPPELLNTLITSVILGPVVGGVAGWFLAFLFPPRRKGTAHDS